MMTMNGLNGRQNTTYGPSKFVKPRGVEGQRMRAGKAYEYEQQKEEQVLRESSF